MHTDNCMSWWLSTACSLVVENWVGTEFAYQEVLSIVLIVLIVENTVNTIQHQTDL